MWRFIAAVLLAGYAPHAADAGSLSIKGLPEPLEWKNAPTSVNMNNGALTIGAGPSTDWYISPLDAKQTHSAPLLLFRPADNFVLTAKLNVEFGTQWDAGVLMVYVNDSTWAKFALEMSVYKEPTIVTVVTRGISDDCNSSPVRGNSVWYRIAKTGQMIGFYSSPDGRSWRMVRAFTFGAAPGLRVGFGSQSPVGHKGQATFSEIAYSAHAIKDIFRGE